MNLNKNSENGTRSIFYNGEQVEQPGTSSVNSIQSSVPIFSYIPDENGELINSFLETDMLDPTLCNVPCLCEMCHFHDDDFFWNGVCSSAVRTERDYGSSPPMVSPVSTYSYPSMTSTPEDVEDALNAMKGAESVIDNNSGNGINLSNPENSVLPAALSKPGCSRTCTGCHDAHRLSASEAAITNKFFKGVKKKKNSDKWTCEIRISKKLRKDSKLKTKGKLWLGTFDTRCQAARALHVGRFLLSEKKNSTMDGTNFEESSKTILSKFKDLMRAKPLDADLLDTVRKLAIEYGKHGSLAISSFVYLSVNTEAVGILDQTQALEQTLKCALLEETTFSGI